MREVRDQVCDQHCGWLFDDPPNTETYIAVSVLQGSEPLRYVIRDHDGDWQFVGEGAGEYSADQLRLICLRDAVQLFPQATALYRLQVGWAAEWREEEHSWEVGPLEREED